jgi:hypothetical protein
MAQTFETLMAGRWGYCSHYEQVVPAFVRATEEFPDDYPDLDIEEGSSCARLPFYKHFRLFDFVVSGFANEKPSVFALGSDEETHWLGGSVDPILRANRVEGLQLTSAQVVDYLLFFLFFVRGTGGAFKLIDEPERFSPSDMDEHQLLELAARDESSRNRLIRLRKAQQMATPIQFGEIDDGARFAVRGATVFGDQLLNCVFTVERSGEVTAVMDPEALDLRGIRTDELPAIRLSER